MAALLQRLLRRAPLPRRLKIGLNPYDIGLWVGMIGEAAAAGSLGQHSMALIKAHDIHENGHVVTFFADDIAARCGAELKKLARAPAANLEAALEEIVKWKSTLQCAHSHDVSKGYFHDAEKVMDWQWTHVVFPLVKDMDFTCVLDLACGHGRNTEYLRRYAKELHLVDINQSCLDACFQRFGDSQNGVPFFYHLTKGNNLDALATGSLSLVYCWDAMVHFDKLIVGDYLKAIARVLQPGGCAFLHHSNLGAQRPDSDWAQNYGTRSDMSAALMRDFAPLHGLEIVSQKLLGLAEGWGRDDLDCASILRKPKIS